MISSFLSNKMLIANGKRCLTIVWMLEAARRHPVPPHDVYYSVHPLCQCANCKGNNKTCPRMKKPPPLQKTIFIYILKLKLEVKGWSEQQRNIGNTAAVFASILAHRPVEMSTGKQATVECDRIPCLVETTQGWTTKEAAREGIGAALIWCMYMIELHQRFTVWPNQILFSPSSNIRQY